MKKITWVHVSSSYRYKFIINKYIYCLGRIHVTYSESLFAVHEQSNSEKVGYETTEQQTVGKKKKKKRRHR